MSELEKTMAENPVENSEVETEATATVEEPAVAAPTEEIAAETTEQGENTDPNFAEEFEKTLVRIRNGKPRRRSKYRRPD